MPLRCKRWFAQLGLAAMTFGGGPAHAPKTRVGATAERSNGPVIDEALKQAAPNKQALHYGNDALGSLLQIQRLGRLEAVLGYWPEIRYHTLQQGIATDDLSFSPIKGTAPYQRTPIGCSDTPQGCRAIERIGPVLRDILCNGCSKPTPRGSTR